MMDLEENSVDVVFSNWLLMYLDDEEVSNASDDIMDMETVSRDRSAEGEERGAEAAKVTREADRIHKATIINTIGRCFETLQTWEPTGNLMLDIPCN